VGRDRGEAALVAAVAAVATLVPGTPGVAQTAGPAGPQAAVPFSVRGSLEQVATWGHAPGAQVSIRRVGDTWSLARAADAQGALIFRDLEPGAEYVVGTSAGEADPVTVLDPGDHPDQSFYDGVEIEPGYGYIPTRDGTLLSANVVMPFAGTTTGPRPVVVTYSGYDPSNPDSLPPEALPYAARGYVVVAVNMRGSGCSGGAFHYYEPATSTDGYDVIEAVAAQDWSNGRVGMVGISYSGISQLYVAATQPPHLRAITPLSPYSDAYRGILYPGGIRNEGFALEWALDRQEAARPAARPWVRDRIADGDTVCEDNQVLRLQSQDLEAEITPERFDSEEYEYLSITSFADRIQVPTYLAVQLQDEQTGGSAAELATILQSSRHTFRAVFGNGAHADPMGPTELPRVMEFVDFYVGRQVPDLSVLRPLLPDVLGDLFEQPIDVPPDRFTGMSFTQAKLAYEREQPIRVRYEVGGVPGREGAPYATTERSYAGWPIAGTSAQRWYLQPDGGLATTPPTVPDDVARATSSYRYAPDEIRPPTFDGGTEDLWKRHPDLRWASPAEDTALTFTTPPVHSTSVYAGTGSVDLWVGSTAADTDLEAVITEVRPDGQEVFVQSGWLRVSHRALDEGRSTPLRPWPTHREEDAAPIPSGELVPVRLALFPFTHVVRPGARLRLSIEAPGGNQPLWDFSELAGEATNRVAHSAGRPSSVALPLVNYPGANAGFPTTAPSCSVPGVTTQAQSLRNQPCRDDRSPRRPGAIVARGFGYGEPAEGGVHVGWTAPVRWPGTAGPTGYTVSIPELDRHMSVDGTDLSARVLSIPRGTEVTAVVTPVYADGGGVPSDASLPVTIPPVTDGEAFVRAAHEDLLGREATALELMTDAVDVDSGLTTRRAVATRLAGSEEWVATIVDGLYEDTLGRPGDPDGRAFWIDAIRSGRVSVAKAAASFYGSDEYVDRAGTLRAWVAELYDVVLGRTAGDDELDWWVAQIPRGRGWVALQIFQSPESAATRVQDLYQALLGRAAEPSAVTFWAPRVVARGDIALAVDLVTSAEYLARAHTRSD
jgi:predicted acyl esterase